jgi:microcystin-dependent protein
MIPYAAIEYYGPLTNFDGTGAGISALGWDKVYLCNGSNGTPDKRGRVGVGAIFDVPGGPLSSVVNPIYAGNPNYDLGDLVGANTVGLNVSQLPSHTHATTVSQSTATKANGLLVDPGHTHYAGHTPEQWGGSGTIGITTNSPQNVLTTSSYTNISVTTAVGVSNGNTGSGENHANIQPVIAAYYIMYIP